MENNREKNKNLHPAEEDTNPITANPAADENTVGNAKMVSIADLMKDLPGNGGYGEDPPAQHGPGRHRTNP